MKRRRLGDDDNDSNEPPVQSVKVPEIILSREQQDVVDNLLERRNVGVIAKAGSGKSSVSIYAGKAFHQKFQKKTLIVTYNTRLKAETRARIESLGLEDMIACHSYHAAAYQYFLGEGSPDDSLIHGALLKKPLVELDFGLVIIDEAQDMNPLYCKFMQHLICHLKQPPTLLIVGDPFQRLFGFNGASDRYLLDPGQHFGLACHSPLFLTRHLTISWRITAEMANFINANLNPNNLQMSCDPGWWAENGEKIAAFWGTGIQANPSRPPAPGSVEIVRGWGSRTVVKAARQLFDQFGNDQVALLAFSLKGKKTPVQAIVDQLGKGDEENWVVLDGKQSMQDEMFKGKRVATTVHRTKGLERKGIVYCGMDDFLERIYTSDPLEAFNICYVGCTRAKNKLVINISGNDYATVRCQPLNQVFSRRSCEIPQLVSYVSFDPLLSMPSNLFAAQIILNFPEKFIRFRNEDFLVEGRCVGTVEDLTPFLTRAILFRLITLTGRALPTLFADSMSDDPDMVSFVAEEHKTDWSTLIRYAVAYETLHTRYTHMWRQLSHYESSETLNKILDGCTSNAWTLLWQFAIREGLILPGTAQPDEDQKTAQIISPWLEFQTPTQFPYHCDWFRSGHVPMINGTVDLLFNKSLVMGLEFSDTIMGERGLELQLHNSMRNLNLGVNRTTVMLLTNHAQVVTVDLKIEPLVPSVPTDFEFVDRVIRRKLHFSPPTPEQLVRDFQTYEQRTK